MVLSLIVSDPQDNCVIPAFKPSNIFDPTNHWLNKKILSHSEHKIVKEVAIYGKIYNGYLCQLIQ